MPTPLCLAAVMIAASPLQPLRIDLNPDNDRSDVLSRHAVNWRIPDSESATRTFDGVTVVLRRAGDAGTALTAGWWKAGYDTGAVLASDGVTLRDGDRGGALELELEGLPPGRHSLATWHNTWHAARLSPFHVSVNGAEKLQGVRPSVRVTHDDDAATAWVEFDVVTGQTIVVRFTPDGTGVVDNVVLNGFALDVPDPRLQARRPVPRHDEEHAPSTPILEWQRGTAHGDRIYFGTDEVAVSNATPESPEYRGQTTEPQFSPGSLDPFRTYFWRVDQDHGGGIVVRGNVWRFKVRRLAFPGAEGYGRFAAGGREGRVIEVTNLDDSGPGSLRAAVEAEGPRTVVFRTGGTIRLESKLVIRNPYITIAGQTAPGDGICIRGYTFGCLGTHDVIIRHVRIRVGDEAHVTMDGTGFASTDHSIMDHCSVSWSIDEGVSSRSAGNITVQRCLIAEALNIADHEKYKPGTGHSYAGSISGEVGSFHHNLLAHCAGRNWSLAGGLNRGGRFSGSLDIRNNVVFNWAHRTTDGGAKRVNFVGNYYIPGPASRVFHLVKPDAGSPDDPQQYFIADNRMEGRPEYDTDNWTAGVVVVDSNLISRIRLTEPFCEPHIATEPAAAAYESVLADVGANLPRYDAVDERILNDVRSRTASTRGSRGGLPGIIDTQTDAGGWPELRTGLPAPDSDHDGLPDDWERTRGMDPADAANGTEVDFESGYTQLEMYLNHVAVRPAP